MLDALQDEDFMERAITAAFWIGIHDGKEEASKALDYFMGNYGKEGCKIPESLFDILLDGEKWNESVYGTLTINLRGCEINGNKIRKQDDDRIEEQRRGSWRS